MARRGKITFRLLLLAGVATVIAGGAWVALGGGIDAARVKAQLEHSVQRSTGRAFSIDGPVHITLGLSPSLTAENIRFANIPGGSRPDMLTARKLRCQVALLPLLTGDVVVEDVVLEGPDILLENGPDGTPNWQFHAARASLYRGPDDAPSTHSSSGQVEFRHLHLANGFIAITSPNLPRIAAALDSADIQAESGSAPMRADIAGSADNVPFKLTINAGSFDRLQGGPVTALAGAWPLSVKAQAAGATLKLDGGINHPDELRGYGFLVTGNAPDFTPLAQWLPKQLALPFKDVNFTVRLTDGSNGIFHTSSLSLHAGAADLSAAVPGLVLKEAVFSAPGPGQQTELNVDGTFQGTTLRIAGSATQPDTTAGHVPIPIALSAQAASASMSARGTVPPNLSGNGFDLDLDVRVPSLAELAPLAAYKLPDIKDIALGTHLGDAGFRLRGLHFRDLVFGSSIGDLSGNLTVAWSPVITLDGTLTSKRFDIDAARDAITMLSDQIPPAQAPAASASLPPASPLEAQPPMVPPAPAEPAPPPRLIPDTKLPFARLNGLNANLTLSADRVTLGAEPYSDFQARVLANDGKLIVNPLRLTSPQGAVVAALTLDAGIDPPSAAVTVRSPALSANRLATLLGYQGGATGALQIDAQLTGTGDTPQALAASLGGHLGVTMVDGSVTDTVLNALFSNALSTAGIPLPGGSSDVRCFAGRAEFTHGQGRISALSLDTSSVSVDGDGTIDLATEELGLHLRPIARLGGTGVAAPVSVTGPLGQLKVALDPAPNGRVSLTIGGPPPSDDSCIAQLSAARGGMAGPMPSVAAPQPGKKKKKPIDLLQGLFH